MDSFQRLIAGVAASAFIDYTEDKSPKRRKLTKHKTVEKAESLTPKQLETLISVAEGRAALLDGFAIRTTPLGWEVTGFTVESETHTVLKDLSSCTCGENKFRRKECKHIAALRRFTK